MKMSEFPSRLRRVLVDRDGTLRIWLILAIFGLIVLLPLLWG